MQRLKQFARQLYDALLPNATATSWSQCGEDMLVRHYLLQTHARPSRLLAFTGGTRLRPGFYVDVGAFSPKRYSNTYWLYRQGWRGITVEPRRRSAWMFRVARPRDVHVVGAVGETEGRVNFAGSAYSPVNSIGGATGGDRDSIDCMRLSSLLDRHLPASTAIDFLSIDCEGGDLGVLRSNDWSRFRPTLICVEDFEWQPTSAQSPIAVLLTGVGYRVVGWSAPSVLWSPNASPTRVVDEA